jgi:hypothetical protein
VILVCIPERPWELALVMSLFDAHGVPHFVHNFGFGGLYPGPQVDLYNLRKIYVPDEMAPFARQLLEDFFPGLGVTPCAMSMPDKVRVVLEFGLMAWFIPGSKWPRCEA